MTARMLWINAKKCNGCMACVTACATVKTGKDNSAYSRIRIIDWNQRELFLPVCCRHCETAPCMAVCPKEAIYRHPADDRVMVDYSLCVSCRMCLAVCPFGAMGFDEHTRMVVKCDLCGGDPACIQPCEPGALMFLDAHRTHDRQTRSAAARIKRRY